MRWPCDDGGDFADGRVVGRWVNVVARFGDAENLIEIR